MLDSIWRVSQKNFDVERFIKKYSISNTANIYVQGEEGRSGKINSKSGFNITVSEDLEPIKNCAEIELFIGSNQGAFLYLQEQSISNFIDIGCTVGSPEQFTKSIAIKPSLLGILAKYNVNLEFSAYPAAHD